MASGTGIGHRPPAWIALVTVPIVVAIALATFSWSAANLEPRDLPLGVAGPAQATAPIEAMLAQQKGAFEIHRYADAAAAMEAIKNRKVYGAVVATPQGTVLLTAPAASVTVANLLKEGLAGEGSGGPRTKVSEVVPADPDDRRGTAFSSIGLPLVLAGVIGGVVVSLLGRPGLEEVGILAGVAALTGLVTIALVQGWLSVLEGPWLRNAGVVALAVFATGATVAGLKALMGYAGLAVGALLFVFVGNPWSGIGSAPELLPKAAGFIGQLLPSGAGSQLLRSSAFFDGAGGGGKILVLLIWSALGTAAILGGAAMRRRGTAVAS